MALTAEEKVELVVLYKQGLKKCTKCKAVKSQTTAKAYHTMELVGCTIEFLKSYIESQFKVGMSWDNYGLDVWHLDHIKPCAAFDLTDIAQQKECFNYLNLSPIWAKDNLIKGSWYNGIRHMHNKEL